jgi:hypothetical protein
MSTDIRKRDIVEEKNILLEMYKDQMVHSRHHEVLRARVSSMIIAVVAGLLGLITYEKQVNMDKLLMIILLIVVGAFGLLLTMKQYQHLLRHLERACGFAEKIQELYPCTKILEIIEEGTNKDKNKYPSSVIKKIPYFPKPELNTFWVALHIIIIILGIVLLAKYLITNYTILFGQDHEEVLSTFVVSCRLGTFGFPSHWL